MSSLWVEFFSPYSVKISLVDSTKKSFIVYIQNNHYFLFLRAPAPL
jgi:hypothetical protein